MPMGERTLRTEEKVGLGAAALLHLALVGVLLWQPDRAEVVMPQERMTVSLSEDVGLEATAPDPVPVSRAAQAPVLAPEPAPPAEAIEAPAPEPVAQPVPRAVTPPPPPAPRPRATQAPRPQPRATQAPRPQPRASEPRRPAESSNARVSRAPAARPAAPARRSGGSRIGADFLPGAGESTTTTETRTPAATFGASEQAALRQAINRQLKPHWRTPQGVDTELLVTVLSWELNPDGSLKGRPRVVRQSGINDANRAQAELHAEQAVRAVQLAAPFNLPDEFYDQWKRVATWSFDRRL